MTTFPPRMFEEMADRFRDDVLMPGARDAVTRITARATSSYMRNAKGELISRDPYRAKKRKPEGPLRILTGRLSRSLTGAFDRSGTRSGGWEFDALSDTRVSVKKPSAIEYDMVHEKGFAGMVRVPPHKRKQTHGWGKPLKTPVTVDVQGHVRIANIPARPYLGPSVRDETPKIVEGYGRRIMLAIRKTLRKWLR